MAIRVQLYAGGGILSGTVTDAARLRDLLEAGDRLDVHRSTWSPLDGSPATDTGSRAVPIDDVLIACGDDEGTIPVHAVWHDVRLVVGPYLVEGALPTMPGFDPGRALTRPTGSFVLLRDVRVDLQERPTVGPAQHRYALVNRYAVDEVAADLMLGFFFPGAHYPPGTGVVAPG